MVKLLTVTYLIVIVVRCVNGSSQLAQEVRINVNQLVQVEENTVKLVSVQKARLSHWLVKLLKSYWTDSLNFACWVILRAFFVIC